MVDLPLGTKPEPRTYADAKAESDAIIMEIEDLEERIEHLQDEIEALYDKRDKIKVELDDLDADAED
jgi:hypothetical protein